MELISKEDMYVYLIKFIHTVESMGREMVSIKDDDSNITNRSFVDKTVILFRCITSVPRKWEKLENAEG